MNVFVLSFSLSKLYPYCWCH